MIVIVIINKIEKLGNSHERAVMKTATPNLKQSTYKLLLFSTCVIKNAQRSVT